MIVFALCCTLGSYLFFKGYDYCIKNKYYDRFNELLNFVGSQNHTGINQYLVSFHIISKMVYTSIIQRLNNSVKKINNNQYDLMFIIEGKPYINRLNIDRGPSSFLEAYDADTKKNISFYMKMYSGPDKTLKNKHLKPCDLGYKNVLIIFDDGNEKLYQADEYFDF